MKQKTTLESDIYTTDRETTPEKKAPRASALGQGTSLLKKNEFTLIISAALVATILIFFFFFRGPSTQQSSEPEAVSVKVDEHIAPGYEDRISALEIALAKIASASGQNENQAASRAVSNLDERISRIETAVNLKLDILIERVAKLEGRLSKVAAVASTPSPKKNVESQPKVKKTSPEPEKKARVAEKKADKPKADKPKEKKADKPKKTNQFHAVQKGETLWSISQKYKTTVDAVRKLNNLTPEDQIQPGSKLLVK